MTTTCGVPSLTLGPCDMPLGHDGDMHGNAGDGFYARCARCRKGLQADDWYEPPHPGPPARGGGGYLCGACAPSEGLLGASPTGKLHYARRLGRREGTPAQRSDPTFYVSACSLAWGIKVAGVVGVAQCGRCLVRVRNARKQERRAARAAAGE